MVETGVSGMFIGAAYPKTAVSFACTVVACTLLFLLQLVLYKQDHCQRLYILELSQYSKQEITCVATPYR